MVVLCLEGETIVFGEHIVCLFCVFVVFLGYVVRLFCVSLCLCGWSANSPADRTKCVERCMIRLSVFPVSYSVLRFVLVV